MNDQLILKFPTHQAYKKEDFYVSPSNQEAYDFINSWPKWIKRIINIFGPSGSGKSTILNCIAGFISPDTGNIKINDKILYKISESNFLRNDNISLNAEHRNIGYVTQKPNLFPSMNVDKNIRYGYKDDNLISVEEIIDTMNIKNLIHRYPNELSGGEAQKVSIARALARFPSVILMDEPVSELDLKSKLMVLGYLKKINESFLKIKKNVFWQLTF